MSAAFHLITPAGDPGTPPGPGAMLEQNRHAGTIWRRTYRDSGEAVTAFLQAVQTEETATLTWSS